VLKNFDPSKSQMMKTHASEARLPSLSYSLVHALSRQKWRNELRKRGNCERKISCSVFYRDKTGVYRDKTWVYAGFYRDKTTVYRDKTGFYRDKIISEQANKFDRSRGERSKCAGGCNGNTSRLPSKMLTA
jgi:hypothetical protein